MDDRCGLSDSDRGRSFSSNTQYLSILAGGRGVIEGGARTVEGYPVV